ncbi:hypothetical protein BK004_03040 [bacterium CG10_46_32]|nr:MAG: hypothetical protein BK004_03040 [bacterium CG10_46_32]PIR56034.1 MAG: hypothetical protein COU73_03075 [Parcubacteria group bacterium CG10_big_fil_rev_8_21_14_0_10_46_32]
MPIRPLSIALFYSDVDRVPQKRKTINAPFWVLYYLANVLTEHGHRVTLFGAPGFASKASVVSKKITNWTAIPYGDALKKEGNYADWARHLGMNDQTHLIDIFKKNDFDIVHAHTELALPLAAQNGHVPTLISYHSPFDPHYSKLFSYYQHEFSNIYFSALSNAHQKQGSPIRFTGIAHNGIDITQFKFNEHPANDLLFIGRIVPEKGPDTAIQVARAVKKPLAIVGPQYYSSKERKQFWDTFIGPYLGTRIQHYGFLPYHKVQKHYQQSKALLFPDRWKEAFGLVLIEAMACGTPVVAFNRGAVPEVIKRGKTGFIVKNEREMIAAVKKIYAMPPDEYTAMRHACREHVEQNFSIERMVENYETLYYKIIDKHKKNHAKTNRRAS